MSKFTVGSRVLVSIPTDLWHPCVGDAAPFTATVTRVLLQSSREGGVFVVRADDGRALEKGADWMAGDWLQPIDADAPAAIGGGN
jgi:hypothetical protein